MCHLISEHKISFWLLVLFLAVNPTFEIFNYYPWKVRLNTGRQADWFYLDSDGYVWPIAAFQGFPWSLCAVFVCVCVCLIVPVEAFPCFHSPLDHCFLFHVLMPLLITFSISHTQLAPSSPVLHKHKLLLTPTQLLSQKTHTPTHPPSTWPSAHLLLWSEAWTWTCSLVFRSLLSVCVSAHIQHAWCTSPCTEHYIIERNCLQLH